MTDIIFTVVKISGRDWAGADGFVCICVDLDLEEKTLKNAKKLDRKNICGLGSEKIQSK